MRIVSRKTFMAMPYGTVFCKYGNYEGDISHQYMGHIQIKWDNCGSDFVCVGFDGSPEGSTCDRTASDAYDAMWNDEGLDIPIDFDCASRDGLFDDKQRFAVYSEQDVKALINMLSSCLVND